MTATAFDLLHTIVGNGVRADRYARMNAPTNPAKYTTVHKPLTDAQIEDHILGRSTYAAIIIGADGLVSASCIELDADSLAGAARVLKAAQIRDIPAFSIAVKGAGNHDGSHTWILFADRVKPENAAYLARQVAEDAGYADAEIWPKGNAIRLPFGVHTHSGSRGRGLLQSGLIYELDEADDLDAFARLVAKLPLNEAPPAPPVISKSTNNPAVNRIKARSLRTSFTPSSPIEQFNAAHSINDLLIQYGAVRTRDGWACNCGYTHSHATQLQITSQGKLVSYSPNCGWAPHMHSGKAQDAFGLYCHVEHGGNVQAAVAALLPEKKSTSNRVLPVEPRYTQDQRDAYNAARREKRYAENRQTLDVLGEYISTLDLPDRAHLLATYLIDLGREAGVLQVRPTNAHVSETLNMCRRYVQYAFRELEAAGLGKRHGGRGGMDAPNEAAIWTFFRSPSLGCIVHQDAECTLDIDKEILDTYLDTCEPPPAAPDSLDTWEWCEDQHGADELNALFAENANIPPMAETQPAARMAQVEAIEAMTDDELRAWMDGFCGKSSYHNPQIVEVEPDAVGASYDPNSENFRIPPDPRAVPSWLRTVGDIGPMVRRDDTDSMQKSECVFLHNIPDPEPEIRCPPSDPVKAQKYYSLLGASKKATNAAQRRKLALLAYGMEEWRRVGDAPRLTSPPAQALLL